MFLTQEDKRARRGFSKGFHHPIHIPVEGRFHLVPPGFAGTGPLVVQAHRLFGKPDRLFVENPGHFLNKFIHRYHGTEKIIKGIFLSRQNLSADLR